MANLRTNDKAFLKEFYPAVKQNTIFTISLNTTPDGVISFPSEGNRQEWWEGFDWYGMAAHAGGLHLSQLMVSEEMAKAVGDEEFANRCRNWINQGQNSMETKMWNEAANSYYMYKDEVMGKMEDKIMANQLDAHWASKFVGLPGVFREDRVEKVLDTVKSCCLTNYGSLSFATPEGGPLVTYGIFTPEMLLLAYTYIYEGDRETGMRIMYNTLYNLVIRQRLMWDMTNMVSGKCKFDKNLSVDGQGVGSGDRTYGHDYYQLMILWSAPTVLSGHNFTAPCQPGGLVDRIITAGRE